MATLSPQNAQKIAELKAQQQQAAIQITRLKNSEAFLEARANEENARKVATDAQQAFSKTTAPPGSDEYNRLASANDAANAAYDKALAEYEPYQKILVEESTKYRTYETQISQVASVPTTSPETTVSEDVNRANAAGNAAASQQIANPPVPPATPPEVPPYNPSLDDALPNDSDPNFIPAPRPTTPSRQSVVTRDDIAEIDATVNFSPEPQTSTDSYALPNDVDPNFISAFQPQQTTTNYITTGDSSAKQIPEEQGVIDNQGDIGTVDLTQAQDDPLGEKIKELQASNTQISTLPNRNQLSGIGSPKDWRFRIALAPGANYLYKGATPGILKPLQATGGVIFPYSPQINISYMASYTAQDLVHTNYKVYNYKNSSVENISIIGDFTSQDSAEANYVLAVIHFFKSVTKMFYGQDQNPARGTPPPLCYLTGFGQYQFDQHPVAITSFTYNFPSDVDYVNAYPTNNSSSIGGQNMEPYMPQITKYFSPLDRLRTLSSNVRFGGNPPPPTFINSQNINEVTRIPAKITIQLNCIPIVTRNAMSNQFSLQQYANGSLLKGTANFSRTGGGIW